MTQEVKNIREFFQSLENLLEKSETPEYVYPGKVDSILQEYNSDWSFKVTFDNTSDTDVEVALLTGGIIQQRVETVDASLQVPAIGGGVIQLSTNYSDGDIIILNDKADLFNKASGFNVDCVATQIHGKDLSAVVSQIVYANASGSLSVSSSAFWFDFLRSFIEKHPVRYYGIQLDSDAPERAFFGKLNLRELSPFQKNETYEVKFEESISALANVETKVEIPITGYFGPDTAASVVCPKNSKFDMTFKFSAFQSDFYKMRSDLAAESVITAVQNKAIQNATSPVVKLTPS